MDSGLHVPIDELHRRIDALHRLRRYWATGDKAALQVAQEVLGADLCAELLAGGSFKLAEPVYVSRKWGK